MFWTNFVKTLGKILLAVMLIASFIAFIAAAKQSFLMGLVILVVGVIMSFISVSGIMLICEISQNIGSIKDHLTGTNSANESLSINSLAQNLGINLNQIPGQSAPAQAPVQPQAPAQPQAPVQQTQAAPAQNDKVDLTK